jgi:hypothetical protein
MTLSKQPAPQEPEPPPSLQIPNEDWWEQFSPTAPWVKLTEPGDAVSGLIVDMRRHRFQGANRPSLELVFEDGRTFTASATLLLQILYELRPARGDEITITLRSIAARANGRNLHHFHVLLATDGVERHGQR